MARLRQACVTLRQAQGERRLGQCTLSKCHSVQLPLARFREEPSRASSRIASDLCAHSVSALPMQMEPRTLRPSLRGLPQTANRCDEHPMNVLIIYAHPEPTSFTGAMRDAAVRALQDGGHAVEVSDLHAEVFNPVAGRHDFTTAADPHRFHYQSEQLHASKTNGFASDLREQGRVTRADLLIFLFPIWWGGLPAILKRWFDRVLAYGFAYANGPQPCAVSRTIRCTGTAGRINPSLAGDRPTPPPRSRHPLRCARLSNASRFNPINAENRPGR